MRSLRIFFLATDIGFILYWVITLIGVIPPAYLFKDYHNPILNAWNWSFLPLDLFVSATGLWSLRLAAHNDERWKKMALVSLVLTFSSGLMAIVFWSIRRDFDLSWWLPNLYLMLYPIYYIKKLLEEKHE